MNFFFRGLLGTEMITCYTVIGKINILSTLSNAAHYHVNENKL